MERMIKEALEIEKRPGNFSDEDCSKVIHLKNLSNKKINGRRIQCRVKKKGGSKD